MDNPRSASGDATSGIPDDLRCKRSDGKQWRCTAMSMPDKTVCEKHYVQAKKRAANSALRASMKKAKGKSLGESDIYLESKSDDMMDSSLVHSRVADYPVSISGKKYKENVLKNRVNYSPETPSMGNSYYLNSLKSNDDLERDVEQYEENLKSYKAPNLSAVESSKSRSEKNFDRSPVTESSDGSSDSSDDTGGQPCHQCRQNDREVFWCLKCERRGYCDNCISTWYSASPLEEIQNACPACRGICNCKVCLRSDNFIKVKIREIPVKEKLEYLYCLLSSVLPVVKRIHREQCSEVELERRLRGNEIDLVRMKLNADEQMCCDFCRIPIIDYHRHCMNCSYDICLSCCQDLRDVSTCDKEKVESDNTMRNDEKETLSVQVKSSKLKLLDKFSNWRANRDGSIPCPPKEYGGCGCSSLTLKRIFKMNWVAKLVKNVEEMVNGCKVYDAVVPQKTGFDYRLCQFAYREDDNNNYLYCPSSEDIKAEGIENFRKHWIRGEPVIVREVMDISSMSKWDPMVIWKGIRETAEEKMKDDNRTVKALDCLEYSEDDIELGQFMKGYFEGRIRENGMPEMLKLKNWPSPSAFEEFLMYQRPEIIRKLPLLEYIHSKWGLLNVAAKLPHYSLQNDVGPKVFISYGAYEELGRGDSVSNLHFNKRDMVYLLVHTCDVKLKGWQGTKNEIIQNAYEESKASRLPKDPQVSLKNDGSPKISLGQHEKQDQHEGSLDLMKDERMDDVATSMVEEKTVTCEDMNMDDAAPSMVDEKTITCEDLNMDNVATSMVEEKTISCEDLNTDDVATSIVEAKTIMCEDLNGASGETFKKSCPGAFWDVFRRRDVPKLIEYLKIHWKEFGKPDDFIDDSVPRSLYDGLIFLNSFHKRKLKEELGVEPWSFEQHLGQAVFLPAGCPFQVRNLQSTVQLSLDFLSPESLEEAVRLAEEIRGLPNDHDAKLQILEVGKISLYAASSAIKEVQKLVLDPKLDAELGFEDPNLTASVSENLEKMIKLRQIACV